MTNDNQAYLKTEDKDAFYVMRKKRLHALRDDIKHGKETMYDFEKSIEELIVSLAKNSTSTF